VSLSSLKSAFSDEISSRVAEMEEKLDGIMTLLASQAAKESPLVTTVTTPETQSKASENASPWKFSRDPSLGVVGDAQHEDPSQEISTFLLPIYDEFTDVISKGMVSIGQAEESLKLFSTGACTFPFVIIPPRASLESFRRERPFLLHAILTTTNQANLSLQDDLEYEFRQALGRKYIVNGEKSLDLLQGILVYLKW